MADRQQRPYVDPQHLTDDETGLYELVATFEYQGRPMTQEVMSAAAGLDGSEAARALQRLTERNVLVRADAGGEPAYALARRDWSAAPGVRRHFPPGHGAEEQEPASRPPAGTPQAPAPDRPGRDAQRQEALAEQVRAEHLRGEQERGDQARTELEQHPGAGSGGEQEGAVGEKRAGTVAESRARSGHAAGPAADATATEPADATATEPAGATATEHLMAGPAPQGKVRNAPDTLIAQADHEGQRPARARFVANTVPGKPDGEVDTRS